MPKKKAITPPKGADTSPVRTERTRAKSQLKKNPIRKDGGIFGHDRKMKK